MGNLTTCIPKIPGLDPDDVKAITALARDLETAERMPRDQAAAEAVQTQLAEARADLANIVSLANKQRPAAPAPEPKLTALKNEVNDAEREELGGERIERGPRVANQDTLDAGRAAIEADPNLPGVTVERIINGAPFTLEDAGVLLAHKVTLRATLDESYARMTDPLLDEAARDDARNTYRKTRFELLDLQVAIAMRGSESGRLLQIQRAMVDEDYTVIPMLMELRNAKESPLTEQEEAKIEQLSEKYAALAKELTETQAKLEAETLRAEGAELVVSMRASLGITGPKEARAKSVRPSIAKLEARADRARARLKAAPDVPKNRGQSGAVLGPAVFADYLDIGIYNVARSLSDFADWSAEMANQLGDIYTKLAESVKRAIHTEAVSRWESTEAKPTKTPAEIINGIEVGDITPHVLHRLALSYVEDGLIDGQTRTQGLETLLAKMAADLQVKQDGITPREVGIALTNYGKVIYPSKEAARVLLTELKEIARLDESLRRENEGTGALRTGMQRQKPTEEIRRRMRQLNDMLKAKERQFRDSPEGLATYQEMRRTSLTNRLESLRRQIAAGERDVRAKSPPLAGSNIDLEAEVKELEADLRAIEKAKKPQKSPEQIYNENARKNMQRQIERLEQKIATNDVSKPVKVERVLDIESLELQTKLNKVRFDFAVLVHEAEFANRTKIDKGWGYAGEALGLIRNVMASSDLPPVLRQGLGLFTAGRWGPLARAFAGGVQAMTSKAASLRVNQKVWNDPAYKMASRKWTHRGRTTRLAVSQPGEEFGLGKVEETLASRYMDKLPRGLLGSAVGAGIGAFKYGPVGAVVGAGVGYNGREIVKASARGFEAFLSITRLEHFKAMSANIVQGTPTQAQGYAIANMVNVFSGRGDLGKYDPSAGLQAAFLFAPRFTVGQFQTILLQPLRRAERGRAMNYIALEYARRIAGTTAMMGMVAFYAGLWGFDDEEEKRRKEKNKTTIKGDIRQSGFGEVMYGKDVHLNWHAGLSQTVVLLARQITGEKMQGNGKLVPLRDGWRWNDFKDVIRKHYPATGKYLKKEKYAPKSLDKKGKLPYLAGTNLDVIEDYFRGKGSPGVSIGSTVTDNMSNMVGDKQTPLSMITNSVSPMTPRGILDLLETEHGIHPKIGFSTLSMLGSSMNIYDPDEKDKDGEPPPSKDPRL